MDIKSITKWQETIGERREKLKPSHEYDWG